MANTNLHKCLLFIGLQGAIIELRRATIGCGATIVCGAILGCEARTEKPFKTELPPNVDIFVAAV